MIVLCLSFCHQLNQSEFQDMDDETRAQYEGFRPGVYVRVEVRLLCYIPFTLFSYYSLSARLGRHGGSHWYQQSTSMCQSTNFVQKGGIFWID